MMQREPGLSNVITINHGVDTDSFYPMPEEQRSVVRQQFGDENTFIVGCVARNQPRKGLPRLFKTARLFINPWTNCEDCGETVMQKLDKCQVCGSENVMHGEGKDNVRFYFHMALKDCGWDIYELIKRFNLEGRVAYPKGLEIGRGVTTEKLNELMNAFDVFTLPTTGEGWGLPILEALSVGIPSVVTNYSAHVDFCQGVAGLVDVAEFICEPMTNIERAYVDVYDYCMRLDSLYYDDADLFYKKWGKHLALTHPEILERRPQTGREMRENMSKASRERALEYRWDRINDEWVELINKVLDYDPSTVKVERKTDYAMEEV
jgi:glycosyltransferase involved in cell wall biosynthesis